MNMKIRAKFKCTSVMVSDAEDLGSVVTLEPVISGSEENEKFFQMTPWGKLHMGVVNPDVQFEVGQEYYIDFSKA